MVAQFGRMALKASSWPFMNAWNPETSILMFESVFSRAEESVRRDRVLTERGDYLGK
jgi:hypothetical protein